MALAQVEQRRLFELIATFITIAVLIGLSRLETRLFEISTELVRDQSYVTSVIYFAIININVVLLLFLGFLVFRQVMKLVLDRRRGVLGSSLRTKLVAALLLFSLAPTCVIFYISAGFIKRSFDDWFSERVKVTIQRTKDASAAVYRQDQTRLEGIARIAANRLSAAPSLTSNSKPGLIYSPALLGFVNEYGLSSLKVFDRDAQQIWPDGESPHSDLEKSVLLHALSRFESQNGLLSLSSVEGEDEQDVVRAAVPIYSGNPKRFMGVVLATERFETSILKSIETILLGFANLRPGAQLVRLSYFILMGIMVLLITFASLWLGFYVARAITTPLQSLAEATREVALGNYSITLTPRTDDETGELVRSFNQMTRDLHRHKIEAEEAAAEKIKAQRAIAWGEVARRIAHEIKNPITPIKLNAERLLRRYSETFEGEDKKVFSTCLQTILVQVDSLKNLVNEFSRFSRLPEIHPKPNNINKVMHDVVDLFRLSYPDIEFVVVEGADVPELSFDAAQMNRVLVNLATNAIAALQGAAPLKGRIEFRSEWLADLKTVRLEVVDNGPGIPADIRTKVFEPYFSTKPGGTGLGLSIVNQVITEHGGYIRLTDNTPQGTVVTIELPYVAG